MLSASALRRTLAVAFATGALALVALPASAHAELISSDPEDGATVSELTTVHLEFSEDLLDIGNSVVVTDGDGVQHEGELTFPEPNQMDAAVTDVAPGDVTIAWRNVSVDGHSEEGVLHVTLIGESPSPSPTPTVTVTATATAEPSASPSASPSVSASADEAGGSAGMPTWVWALLGLVVIGGAAAALIAATRKPPTES